MLELGWRIHRCVVVGKLRGIVLENVFVLVRCVYDFRVQC
jgi:hypothetical protein